MSKTKIERIAPNVTIEQVTDLVKAAVTSKTNELEQAVAKVIGWYTMPPMIVSDRNLRDEFSKPMVPGSLILDEDN